MSENLKRPLALVTGASRGIGAQIAIKLAKDGYDILLNYRSNHDLANEVKKEIELLGGGVTLLPFDVSDFNSVKKSLEKYGDKENAISVLVNNAGIRRDMLLLWMEESDWEDVIKTNLSGTFNVTRWVLGGMLSKRDGVIINITSTSGQSGMPGQVNYASAKAGQIAATKSLALEVGKRNIRVNAVAPGFIDTDLTDELPKDEIIKRIPLKRFGTASEIASVVSFLCSSASSYITGEVISVNGGIYT